jgi:hypothetical protein
MNSMDCSYFVNVGAVCRQFALASPLLLSAFITTPVYAFTDICAALSSPVYQVINPQSQANLLTTWLNEAVSAKKHGFTQTNDAPFYASRTAADGLVAVHRLYNAGTNDFIWITDPGEISSAISKSHYADNGINFYVSSSQSSCTHPVYRFSKGVMHRFAVSRTDRDALAASGWTSEGIKFHAGTGPAPLTAGSLPTERQKRAKEARKKPESSGGSAQADDNSPPAASSSASAASGSSSQIAPIGRRIALVIGNSDYASVGYLPNPIRDADAVATNLRKTGFQTVTIKNDMTRAQMIAALNDFSDQAADADWALIYFSGHGLQLGGANYILPVDAKLLADRDVQDEAVPLDRLLSATVGARKLRLVILDACRDNPFIPKMRQTVATRSVGRGFARVEPEGATLVVYAARDGQIAYDGDGPNSPFAASLTKRIAEPNLEISKLFRLVHDDVMAATGKRQEPYVYGALPGDDFYFVQK